MKRIFITGASGCIGHYIAETLINHTSYELYFLVRNPDKLLFDYNSRPGIHLIKEDLKNINQLSNFLKTVNVAILAATSWGGDVESYEINVSSTMDLINLLDPEICQQIIYFSTASILNSNSKPLLEAKTLGTNYVRTKYQCYIRLQELSIYNKIVTVFPTLVFGGEKDKPYSHLSGGINDVIKWINLIRFFKVDGSFHYIHAKDIAQIIKYVIQNPSLTLVNKDIVLGNKKTTVNEAVEKICKYLDKQIYFRIPLSITLANIFIKIFRLRMEAWDYFSMNYRHFTYKKTTIPFDFGINNYCTTIENLMTLSKIKKEKNQ